MKKSFAPKEIASKKIAPLRDDSWNNAAGTIMKKAIVKEDTAKAIAVRKATIHASDSAGTIFQPTTSHTPRPFINAVGDWANQDGGDDEQSGVGAFITDNAPTILTGVFGLADIALGAKPGQNTPPKPVQPPPVVKAPPPVAPKSNVGTYVLISIAGLAVIGGIIFVVGKAKKSK